MPDNKPVEGNFLTIDYGRLSEGIARELELDNCKNLFSAVTNFRLAL